MSDGKGVKPARIVKDFLQSPIFGVTPHRNEIRSGNNLWLTGVKTPLMEAKGIEPSVKGLSVEHAEVLIGIMAFQPTEYLFAPNDSSEWKFSLKRLSETIYGNYSSKHSKKLKALLSDLVDCWSSMYNEETKITHYFRVLESISIYSKPSKRNDRTQEFWFDNIKVHESYTRLIMSLTESLMIDVSLFREIKNKIAKGIYMYLPSRAIHRTQKKPFEISLTKLFSDLGIESTKTKNKAGRKQLMNQGKTSIMEQLDKAKISKGVFRCDLRESADKTDWIFQCWSEGNEKFLPQKTETGKFFQDLGFNSIQWAKLVDKSNTVTIASHTEDYLQRFNLDSSGNWQARIYSLALGEFFFHDEVARLSDGEIEFGLIVTKCREKLKKMKLNNSLKKDF